MVGKEQDATERAFQGLSIIDYQRGDTLVNVTQFLPSHSCSKHVDDKLLAVSS
jgi:hypothetical protein